MEFEWDAAKAAANLRKHRVSFEEASTVFMDPYALTDPDEAHSTTEDRDITIGRTNRGRVVIVVTTERGSNVRLISARRATSAEVQAYEEEVDRTNRGER
jgi:uncharacterized DUF497 family protein